MKKINGIGPRDAKLWIVGEAPGAQEEANGVPFVGPAGGVLDRGLRVAGIQRAQCRIDNVCRVRPPGNDFSRLPEDLVIREEMRLREEIREASPNLVLALGEKPAHALLGRKGSTKLRGSLWWVEELGVKVLCTLHPAYILRQWAESPLFSADLRKAALESRFKEHKVRPRKSIIDPSLTEALTLLEEMHSVEVFAFDLETTRSSEERPAYMTHLAISSEPEWAFCIPFQASVGSDVKDNWALQEEVTLIRAISSLMLDPKPLKVAHNWQFDAGVLEWTLGIRPVSFAMDTMAAMHTCHPELPKSLNCCRSLFTDVPYYDDLTGTGEEGFRTYNCLDAMVCRELFDVFHDRELVAANVHEFYYKLPHPQVRNNLILQLRGVRIDERRKLEATVEVGREIVELMHSIWEACGHQFNIRSKKQLGEVLYDELGLPEQTKKSKTTGKVSRTVDSDALEKLKKKAPVLIGKILRFNELEKLSSTYLEVPLTHGRMHTSYNVGGSLSNTTAKLENIKAVVKSAPTTGRLSSSTSIVIGTGTNNQNIPKGPVRRMFIPDGEWWWLSVDLSGAEARVVAWLANEPKLKQAFKDDLDIHRYMAEIVFNIPYAEVDAATRYEAKRDVHAANYLETPTGLSRRTGMPLYQAQMIHAAYFNAFPGLKRWHSSIEAELKSTGQLTTPLGRRRRFYGRWSDSLMREACAYKPQATVADVTSLAQDCLQRMEEQLPLQVLQNVHDELNLQFEPSHLFPVVEAVREAFNIPIPFPEEDLVIPVDIEIGLNWQDTKPLEEVLAFIEGDQQ